MNRQAETRLLADLAEQFINAAAAHGAPHRLLLEALMTAFVAVAETHACCTAAAADTAQRCADRLAQAAAHRPAAPNLH